MVTKSESGCPDLFMYGCKLFVNMLIIISKIKSKEKLMKRFRFIIFTIVTFAWLGVIYSFSLEPADVSDDTSLGLVDSLVNMFLPWLKDELAQLSQPQMDVLHTFVRKCAHFTEYMILGILAALTLLQTKITRWKNIALLSIGYCILAASVDETIQLFVDGRAGRIGDVVIDGAGAAVGVGIVFSILRLWKSWKIRIL